jgi:hypothetical protein
MNVNRAYEEVIKLIAAESSPSKVIAFRPSETAKARVADLVIREKTGSLTPDETSELEWRPPPWSWRGRSHGSLSPSSRT